MITAGFPELFVSLTLQCTVLLLVTRVLALRAFTSAEADQFWGLAHLLVLILCVIGVAMPHIRLIQEDDLMMFLNQVANGTLFRLLSAAIGIIWLIVAAVLVARTVWSLICTNSMVCRARECSLEDGSSDLPISRWSAETQQRLTEQHARVLCSDETITPFCWQLHSPVIVLPESLTSFPSDELDAVLRHELAHLKAQHPLRLFLQTLVEILFWFHPLVWWSSNEASLQRELASDLMANESASQAATFLKGMLRLAEFCTTRTSRLAAGLRFGGVGRSMIQHRVDQLLSADWSLRMVSTKSSPGSAALVVIAILVSTMWIPLNAQATGRTLLSPWPSFSAALLHEMGLNVRDYEVDTHRLQDHRHQQEQRARSLNHGRTSG